METIIDYAGNTYPAAMLDGQESPNFDVWGARKDRAWQALGTLMQDEASKTPHKGDRVVVTGGRKHKGKEGVVFWRGRDQFSRGGRYGDDMVRAFAEASGRYDRLGIRTDDGEKFFTKLPYTEKVN